MNEMAKKNKVTELPDTNPATEDQDGAESALVVLEAEYELENTAPAIPAEIAADAIKFAQENNEYNVWDPEKEQAIDPKAVVARIVRFLKAKPVEMGNGKNTYQAILATFWDYQAGGKLRVWLGQHVLQKIADEALHQTGNPFCLTYKGKVMSKTYGKEATAWDVYVYSADERRKLFPRS